MGVGSSFLGAVGLGGGSIGTATVDLVLNSTGYTAQLEKSRAETAAATSKTGGLGGALEGITGKFGAAGTAAVAFGAAAIAGIAKAIGTTQAFAAEVRSLQRVTGQTAEQASQLTAAGEALGLDVTKLTTGFGILSKNIVNGSANMAKYGIATKDASGAVLPFDQVLANVSDKFATLPAGPEQAALAMNVFGKSGKDLIPILSRGSEGLQELYDNAKAAGLIMSQDDLDASKNLSLAQRELGAAFKGAAIQIGKVFVPVATTLVKTFVTIVEFVTQKFAPAFESLHKAFGELASAFGDVMDALGPAGPLLAKLFGLIAGAPLAVLIASLEALAFVIDQAAKGTEAFAHLIGPVMADAMNFAVSAINVLIAAYNKAVEISNNLLHTHFDQIDALEQVAPAAEDAAAATDQEAAATDRAAGAIRRHIAALQEQRLELISGAGTLLSLVGSLKDASEAQRTLERLQERGKQGTAAYSEAVINAISAQQSFRAELRQFASDHPGKQFDDIRSVLKELGKQQGVTAQDFKQALGGSLDDIGRRYDNLRDKLRQPLDINTSAAQAELNALEQKLSRIGI